MLNQPAARAAPNPLAPNPAALDRLFHALAAPTRRAVLARLAQGPVSVSEIARPLPVSLPAVHQHLKVLEESGLVRSEKSGRVRTCRLEPAALATAEDWLATQRRLWEGRFDRLEAYLATLQTAAHDGEGAQSQPEKGAMGE